MLKVKKVYVNTSDKMCQYRLNQEAYNLVNQIDKKYNRIAVVCIGTDRSTGDSFGPLVGFMLSRCRIYDFDVYGTIEEPVHAMNLKRPWKKSILIILLSLQLMHLSEELTILDILV